MRLALLRTGEREHQLVWSFHHALLDGWSVSLVLRDVFACYEAFRLHREPALERTRRTPTSPRRAGVITSSGWAVRTGNPRNSSGAATCAASSLRRRCRWQSLMPQELRRPTPKRPPAWRRTSPR
ncbi:condensation domain-containing protein, partial [Mesorhizobium mediterraneum]|uniref:condensation domain-containing protein n=1 Tax=Mesorhizobium mediterraneum TaxID=43617 RepID=UPI003D7E2F98